MLMRTLFRSRRAAPDSVAIPEPRRDGRDPRATHDLRGSVLTVLGELESMAALRLVQVEVVMPEALNVATPAAVLQDAIRAVLIGAIGRAAGGAVLVTGQRIGSVLEIVVLDDGTPRARADLLATLRPVADQLGAQGCALDVPGEGLIPGLAPRAAVAGNGSTVVLRVPAGGEAPAPAWQRPRVEEALLPRVSSAI